MAFTAENVEKAVQQFYHDAINQKEINQWLMSAQTSQQAWTYCWQLLDKEKSPEVQFFGASTLHIKIARFWHEVPTDQVPQLRKSLFEQLFKFAAGPRMVLTRLCVVFSSFTLQTAPDTWKNAVSDIISTFQQSQTEGHLESAQACLVLLELLTVLPEEFISSQFPKQRKSAVRNELAKGVSEVLSLLQICFTSTSPEAVCSQALRCLNGWIQFDINITEIEMLIDHVFKAVQNYAYMDVALEALYSIFSHPDNHRYPRTVFKLLNQVVQLEPALKKAMEAHDIEGCQALCKLMVCAAEQNTLMILNFSLGDDQQRQLALSLVNLVLQCTSLPGFYPVDECCSNVTFGFWYNFQDEIVVSDSEKYRALMQVYTPVYMQLVEVLLRKAQYPSDTEYESWNAEEKEDHRCYRQDIADTLMYAYNLLHDLLLGSLCHLLATSLERSSSGQGSWQEVEAVLFAMTSIAESVGQEENIFLPRLFTMLSCVPCDNYKVISQALYLIGSCAEWISSHPEVLAHVIPLMLQGMKDVELAQSATLSLKEVLRENQSHLGPFVESILTSSKEVLDSGLLKSRDAIRLMSCVGYALSTLPVDDTIKYLNIILLPHIHKLHQLSQSEPTAAAKAGIQLRLQMVTWLFGSLVSGTDEGGSSPTDQNLQPVLLVFQQVLPVLKSVLQNWIMDSGIVEHVCELIKRGLRQLINEKLPFLPDIEELLVQMYQASPQAPMLDLAKQILVLGATDRQYEEASQTLFTTICQTTVTLVQTNPREQPDVLESFMVLLAQVCKKNRRLYETSTCVLPSLFDAGVVCLHMNETTVIKAACHFLNELIGASDSLPVIKEVVRDKGGHLVDLLIRCVGGEAPRTVVDSMADLFLALNKHHCENLAKWLSQLIVQEGYPNNRASKDTKEKFVRGIVMERANRRRMREHVQEYSLIWRGLLGTEYAAQTCDSMASV